MQRAKLFEAPEFGKADMLFTLKDMSYSPETPRMNEPLTVKGKVELLKIPFVAPVWVIVTAEYPETFWEEIIPIIGAPQVREMSMVLAGNFEVTFKKGFAREGEFKLTTRVYAGPTMPIDKITLPPFPPVATEETIFIVGGEVPPEEVGFRSFRILSYSKNGGEPVTPPGVLELDVGDRCRVNVGFDHMDSAVTGKFHAAIWVRQPWDPHDEILAAEKAFSVPASTDWESWEGYIDIPITSAISPGTYGLYVKIMGVPGPDIFTEYLEGVITIVGVPTKPEFKNLEIVSYDETLRVGDTCHTIVRFDYQGPSVSKYLYAAIGNLHHLPTEWFDEILKGSKPISVPETISRQTYEASVDIAIATIDLGFYSLYAKIDGVMPLISPYYENVIEIIWGVAPPAPGGPEAETLAAQEIIHDSATFVGKLVDTGYYGVVDCYFEWGKTTAYGKETPRTRMYDSDEGKKFYAEVLHYLEPDTTYHFRAVAVTVHNDLIGYGTDKSFRTVKETIKGFTMRTINAPPDAVAWRAGCVEGGILPYMKVSEPLDYMWEWTKSVPDESKTFFVQLTDKDRHLVKYDEFPFRLKNGKRYVYDWSTPYPGTYRMIEE